MKILSILIILPIFSFGQISNELKVYVDSLSKVERYESSNIGAGGTYSKVYDLFSKASEIATDQEVEYLAINGKAIVKSYFSSEAINRKLESINDIFKYHLSNNEEFNRIYGCLGGKEDLVSKMYSDIIYFKEHSWVLEAFGEETKWNEQDAKKKLKEFNEIILNSRNPDDRFLAYIIMSNEKELTKNCKNILPMIKSNESDEVQYVRKICEK